MMQQNKRLWVGLVALGVASASGLAQTVTGSLVTLYAEVPAPQRMTFDPMTGDLYVGQGFAETLASPIRRVSGADQTVSDFGPGIRDADAVLFDSDGSLTGTAGSVLVGSGFGLFGIGPDESLVEIDTSRMNFSNPTDFQVLSNGDLVFSDFQGEAIIQFDINETPVAWDFIVPTSPSTEALTLGLGGELYVTDRSGQILITDTDTLDTTIGRDDAGRQYRWMTAVDERPGFDDGLLVWDGASDELLLFADFDLTSDPTVVGTGFEDVRDLTFGPDGALYVALNRGEIVRVTPDVVPAPGALAALGLGLIGANRRRRLG